MNRPKKTCTAMVLCAAVLSQSFAFDTYGTSAADSSVSKSAPAASMFTLDKLGSVTLKQSVSVKLTDMDIFAQPDGNILTYTLRYSNNSGSRVDPFSSWHVSIRGRGC
jgi:ferredoxin